MLGACEQKPLSAEDVAHEFWQAVGSGKPTKVEKWVSSETTVPIQQDDFPALMAYQFDKMVIEPQRAVFDTVLTTANEEQAVPVKTFLVNNNEQWQVDYTRTLASYQRHDQVEEIFSQLSELGELLNDEINQSLDKLNETLPKLEQEIDQIEKKVETELPQLQQKFQSFMEKLHEFLQRFQNSDSGDSDATEI